MNPRPARAAVADGAHGPPGATLKEIPLDVLLAVNGTLMRGLELNGCGGGDVVGEGTLGTYGTC